jgi:hypothetical protein
MFSFLKVFGLVAVVIGLMGCGGHYVMDGYIDQNQIVSSNSPDAIKVYVKKLNFNDGPGGPQSLNKSTAEGEISPWIKKAIKDEVDNVNFVDNKQHADIVIEPQRVEFNVGAWGPKNLIGAMVNNQEITVVAYGKTNNGLSPLNNMQFSNMLMASSKLLVYALKQSISVTNGKVVILNIPKKINATFRNNDNQNFNGDLYDIEVTRADGFLSVR